MKLKALFLAPVVIVAGGLVGQLAYAQDMPSGNLLVNTRCVINDGHTFEEAVEVGRYIDFQGDDAPNLVFFRQPIAGPNSLPNGLLRVVYWDSLAHWARGQAALPAPSGPSAHLNEIMTCDQSNRSFFINRNIDQEGAAYEGGESDFSLTAARACRVKPGNGIQDVYSALGTINERYRAQGDRTLVQLSQRFLGPRPGLEMGAGILLRLVGETPEGLAARLDMAPKNAGVPEDAPVVGCGDYSLWASHVIHWGL